MDFNSNGYTSGTSSLLLSNKCCTDVVNINVKVMVQAHMSASADNRSSDTREFKKLRRQLQRKRYIKIEFCVKSSLLRLFHVVHVVQNRRNVLLLAWYEWFFM